MGNTMESRRSGQPVNRLEQLYASSPDPSAFARGYLTYLAEVLAALDTDEIAAFIATLIAARERGSRIFFIGNGGSAATASHFANDIAIGSQSWELPFQAISLTDNVAVISAIANDYGFEQVFVKQLHAYMTPGDVVVAISVSGNSPNIVKAVEYANEHEATTVGVTGFDGGRLRELAHVAVHVPTNAGEYGPAEDGHMILDHLIGSYLMQLCRVP
jgi:D-sedoheptulose 7-phosphate isomerase